MPNSYIGLVKISDTSYKIGSTLYGLCETPTNNSDKEVIIEGFKNTDGVTAHIKFVNA
jgi:hypothetical protein